MWRFVTAGAFVLIAIGSAITGAKTWGTDSRDFLVFPAIFLVGAVVVVWTEYCERKKNTRTHHRC